MSKRKPAVLSQWPGDLATPITLPARVGFATATLFPDAVKKWRSKAGKVLISETFRKLDLLAQYYGVTVNESGDWMGVLLALSRDCVPGFQVTTVRPPRRGRPADKWGIRGYTLLIADVEAVMAKSKCTQRDALRELIKTNPAYQSPGGVPRASDTWKKAIDTLETRLIEARKPGYNAIALTIAELKKLGLQDVLFEFLRDEKTSRHGNSAE